MLNIEKYKDQILNIHEKNWLSIECAIGNVRGVHLPCNQNCNECELLSLIWLSKEAEEPILDDAEKKYLSAVIKPFRNKVEYIAKFKSACSENEQYIHILFYEGHYLSFPYFKANSMYKGMELNKAYTLQELGL